MAGACAGAEFSDEFFELGDLFLFGFILIFRTCAGGGFGDEHRVVVAGIGDDGLVVDVGDVGTDGIEEVAVMADDDEGPLIVGWLVV